MVCDGPDPPDDSPQSLIPPPRNELLMANGNHDESDDDQNEHFGYEPLPQGLESVLSDHESDDDNSPSSEPILPNSVPPIEPMESALTRDIWNMPRINDPIQMDNERVQQVMSLMANFVLPQASIPEWAQSVSEDQWKETLNDRIEKIKSNR